MFVCPLICEVYNTFLVREICIVYWFVVVMIAVVFSISLSLMETALVHLFSPVCVHDYVLCGPYICIIWCVCA